MKTVAVVPVKSLQEAKSRLSGALTPTERARLTLSMLYHVLETIDASEVISDVAVVSPDATPLSLPHGVVWLPQHPERTGLNDHLEEGREWAERLSADALMIIFADLPTITAGDVRAIAEMGREKNSAVLAHDRHGLGTNVMLVHPPSAARLAFGAGSYPRHRELYHRAGLRVRTYTSPGTSLDIDTPDDLEMLDEIAGARVEVET